MGFLSSLFGIGKKDSKPTGTHPSSNVIFSHEEFLELWTRVGTDLDNLKSNLVKNAKIGAESTRYVASVRNPETYPISLQKSDQKFFMIKKNFPIQKIKSDEPISEKYGYFSPIRGLVIKVGFNMGGASRETEVSSRSDIEMRSDFDMRSRKARKSKVSIPAQIGYKEVYITIIPLLHVTSKVTEYLVFGEYNKDIKLLSKKPTTQPEGSVFAVFNNFFN